MGGVITSFADRCGGLGKIISLTVILCLPKYLTNI